MAEVLTDLRGVRQRGWPPGKSWDTVPGLFHPQTNRVIVMVTGVTFDPVSRRLFIAVRFAWTTGSMSETGHVVYAYRINQRTFASS